MTQPRPRPTLALIIGLFVSLLSLVPAARADEFVDRVNAPFKGIPEDKRSDLVLLPLLAAMDKPPAVLRSQTHAALLGNKGPGWSDCADWAQKKPQKDILDALAKVTKEEDRLKAFAFAQPYGVEGVSVDLISKNMFTELGDPPLLAAAKFLYMPAMENAGILVQVEASRRQEAGDSGGALTVLTDWLFFLRQMADRPFVREKKWALESGKLALERMRDVVYIDFRAEKHTLTPVKVREVIQRLRDRRGFLSLDRLSLPEGDFIAGEQLLARVMEPGGGANPATFGQTMARTAAADRPLRMFSAQAYWDSAKAAAAGQREMSTMLKGVRDDWMKRWDLSTFDKFVVTITDYRRRVLTSAKFAILHDLYRDIDALFQLRQQLKVEAGGTRMSLGAYGFFLRQKNLPQTLASARPEFIDSIDKDAFSKKGYDLEFFVPMRDTPKGPLGEPKPFTVHMYPPDPFPSFQISFGADQFIIYSVGPDDNKGFAVYATQTRTGVQGDYLLFPPTLSLYRQRLLETNQLK